MSTFYLLPPRSVLIDRLLDCMQTWLPGLDVAAADREDLLASLCAVLPGKDVFVVHREDLPAGEGSEQALVDGYGATQGDEVIEVRSTSRVGEFASRRWRISGTCCHRQQSH
jgi:hypothetical protein